MKQFTTAELDTAIASGKTIVVDFFATWCGPCKMLAPIFESAAAKAGDKAEFGKVDIDTETKLVARYGIQSVPTIMAFKAGEVSYRNSGIVSESVLLEQI